MERKLGIYVHIPFCVSKCGYCDFYSMSNCDNLMPQYSKALCKHIEESKQQIENYYIDSVYFGGGTPSYFGADRLIEVLNEIKMTGRLLKDAEITFEANPDSVDLAQLKKLKKAGFNRASLGVQSANNDILKLIGRRHDFRQVLEAVKAIRSAGFYNLSIDLIYGLPSQTKADWADTLAKIIELRPEHISCYGLTLEENTPMYRYKGSPFLPSDDEQADMYLYTVDILQKYGYPQYEVSNFSVAGYESVHNMKYWRLDDYMAFGAAAHANINGLRYSHIRDIQKYIDAVMAGDDLIDEADEISAIERVAEYIMLGMRTVRGISEEEYRTKCKGNFGFIKSLLELYEKNGWAVLEDERWHFTGSGFLLSNTLIAALLDANSGKRVEINPWMQKAYGKIDEPDLPETEEEYFLHEFLGEEI